MSVSIRQKEDTALSALNILIAALMKEYGHNASFWLNIIYRTDFFLNLRDVNTGYWGEGVAFHRHQLLQELTAKGIPY